MTARDTALSVLIACRREQAWSDGSLKRQIAKDKLDRRDAALATRLCFGVLQNRLLLDEWIGRFLRCARSDLQPVVLDILRLAVYQICFMDRIPASAAVDQAVEQGKRLANRQAAGLINGVLRNMLRQPERLTLPENLSLRYSHPQELVALLSQAVPPNELEALLQADNTWPETTVQINTTRATAEQAAAALSREGFTCKPHPWLCDCVILSGGSIEASAAYSDGWIYAQDPAARLAVLAAGPRPGMRVLDCCAAPGGKSFAAGICMEGRGEILSCDIHPHKIKLIEQGARRLGLELIHAQVHDAASEEQGWADAFDLVIADVPCSGLGVIRKKPDIRYKPVEPMARLPEIQKAILRTQAQYVKPGGVLLYSTCTILPRENQAVVEAFLRDHPAYSLQPFCLSGDLCAPDGMLTLYPHIHGTDGFFVAKLRRNP